MRHVNQHFMAWLDRRGNKCADLVLEFIVPISSRAEIENWVSRLLLQDCRFNNIISRLEVECTIQDPITGEALVLDASQRNAAAIHATTTQPSAPKLESAPNGLATPQNFDLSSSLATAIAEARRRIPEFKTLLNLPQAGVTVRVPWVRGDIQDVYEASLVGRDGDQLTVEFTPDYAPGPVRQNYRFEDILDWTVYHENGQQTGGFTACVMEQPQGPETRRIDLQA